MTYTIQNLISRFEELKLPKMAENINTYLDMIVEGRKNSPGIAWRTICDLNCQTRQTWQ